MAICSVCYSKVYQTSIPSYSHFVRLNQNFWFKSRSVLRMIIPMAVRGYLLEIVASIDRRKVVNIRSSLIYCKWSVSRCLLKCLHRRCCSDSIRPLVMALFIASMIRQQHYDSITVRWMAQRLRLKIIDEKDDEKDDIPMGISGAEDPRTTNRLAAVVHKRNFMIWTL